MIVKDFMSSPAKALHEFVCDRIFDIVIEAMTEADDATLTHYADKITVRVKDHAGLQERIYRVMCRIKPPRKDEEIDIL